MAKESILCSHDHHCPLEVGFCSSFIHQETKKEKKNYYIGFLQLEKGKGG